MVFKFCIHLYSSYFKIKSWKEVAALSRNYYDLNSIIINIRKKSD